MYICIWRPFRKFDLLLGSSLFAFFFFLTSESIIHLHHVLEIEKSYQCQMCFRMVALLCTLMQFFIPQSVLKTQHTMNYLICSQWQAAQLKNNQKDNLWANTFLLPQIALFWILHPLRLFLFKYIHSMYF